ncbi:hypothetical protein LNKW23_31760 [Paralimibaculum aggregatum]|uniref:Gluconate 2-dehydrogenase subunit 3 family protein n=1 Tax=Paralimibaculum aggregatum TaxID=3036245 RepID=A0ABQ6LQ07_9RHOB|nr:hypothetical protein [Limibaculum sp. NKW23]GMG83962.1 hypothetical protein LNKW23_31760 [Limibaculum sp. NKW23]
MGRTTRRSFLTNGIGLVAAAAAAGVAGRYALTDIEAILEAIVRHHVGDDALARGAAAAFARDYAPMTASNWKLRSAVASGLYLLPLFRGALPAGDLARIERYDRRVVTDFLLSSSYDGRESGDPIDYLALETAPLCNPFARLR